MSVERTLHVGHLEACMLNTAEAYFDIILFMLPCFFVLKPEWDWPYWHGKKKYSLDGPIGFSSFVRSKSHVNMRLDHML